MGLQGRQVMLCPVRFRMHVQNDKELNDNVNIRVGITGTGSCPGERRQTNGELAEAVANYDPARAGMPLDGWIREHYGIQARARTDRLSSELAADACLEAVRGAGLDVADIDFLILNTVAGDYRQPSTAAEVQGSIGMRADSFAMEINMPCAGSIYGIAVARGLMSAGHGKRALVAGLGQVDHVESVGRQGFGEVAKGGGHRLAGKLHHDGVAVQHAAAQHQQVGAAGIVAIAVQLLEFRVEVTPDLPGMEHGCAEGYAYGQPAHDLRQGKQAQRVQ